MILPNMCKLTKSWLAIVNTKFNNQKLQIIPMNSQSLSVLGTKSLLVDYTPEKINQGSLYFVVASTINNLYKHDYNLEGKVRTARDSRNPVYMTCFLLWTNSSIRTLVLIININSRCFWLSPCINLIFVTNKFF